MPANVTVHHDLMLGHRCTCTQCITARENIVIQNLNSKIGAPSTMNDKINVPEDNSKGIHPSGVQAVPTMKVPRLSTPHHFLDAASACLGSRGEQYDSPTGERSMGRTVHAFNAITGHTLTEAEGWLLLQTLKDVRQWATINTIHEDSALDGVAYSALKCEALANGRTSNPK